MAIKFLFSVFASISFAAFLKLAEKNGGIAMDHQESGCLLFRNLQ